MSQFSLHVLQSAHHLVVFLKGLYQHAVLYRFLQHALHLAVAVTHLACQFAHVAHIHLAREDEHRQHGNDDQSQHGVHGEEIEERTQKEGEHGESAWQRFGEEPHHVADVEFQAVQHIAAVPFLLAMPFGAQDASEQTLLHPVLCLYSQYVLHPYRSDIHGKSAEDEQRHDCHRPIQRTLDDMRRHVDGVFHRPHRKQTYRHIDESEDGIERRLQTVAAPCPPQPSYYLSG